jgi:hypothetical protein
VLAHMRKSTLESTFIFSNKPERINIAIVMYTYFQYFERLCGSIKTFKTIHLLRNPMNVALSLAQLEVDKAKMGSAFAAHRRHYDSPSIHAPISRERVSKLYEAAKQRQNYFARHLRSHKNALTVSYEDLTNNLEVHMMDKPVALRLLNFLSLDYQPLTTTLGKTAPPEYEFFD